MLTQLAASGDERTQTLFEALLRKRLYFEKSSGTLLYVTKNKKGLAAIEVLSGQTFHTAAPRFALDKHTPAVLIPLGHPCARE